MLVQRTPKGTSLLREMSTIMGEATRGEAGTSSAPANEPVAIETRPRHVAA